MRVKYLLKALIQILIAIVLLLLASIWGSAKDSRINEFDYSSIQEHIGVVRDICFEGTITEKFHNLYIESDDGSLVRISLNDASEYHVGDSVVYYTDGNHTSLDKDIIVKSAGFMLFEVEILFGLLSGMISVFAFVDLFRAFKYSCYSGEDKCQAGKSKSKVEIQKKEYQLH